MLNRAYVYTVQKHGTQKRASGDPYFSHPVEVAGLMTELKLDQETIMTALLHDTVEDTLATVEEIERLFGPDVARLVDGVTKLSKIETMTESERAAENLRKFLLAMSEDLRVLLVKLADRLHNMRTLHFIKSEDKRRRIARETMEIYAPLAQRVGMYEYMREMQLLAFEQLEPEAYATIEGRLTAIRAEGGGEVDDIALSISQALAQAGLRVEVEGREKHPYSIWKKMAERHVSFEQITDIMAFRVLVDDIDECYKALGVLHQTWQMIPGRFKDYISTPKMNGYKSLHTSLIYNNARRVEVQIKTREMHHRNEYGLAAHWAYKQGGTPDGEVGWLRDLVEILDASHDAEELLENTKMAIYQDRIFAFTPKGALFQMPKGATPIDFAFAVHTNLGAQAVGAKINGRHVLAHPAGQWRCGRDHQEPQFRATAFVAGLCRDRQGARGHPPRGPAKGTRRSRPDRPQALRRDHRTPAHPGRQEGAGRSDQAAQAHVRGRPDGRHRHGQARRSSGHGSARARLHGHHAQSRGVAPPAAGHRRAGADTGHGLQAGRMLPPGSGRPHRGPAPSGAGVEVHAIDCETLADGIDADWIDLSWDKRTDGAVGRIRAELYNRPGTLAEMAGIFANNHANVVNLEMTQRENPFHTYLVDLEVRDLAHLTRIVSALRASDAVAQADRI
jgi:GTP pyrophosphokinase